VNFVGLGHSHVVALAKGCYGLQQKGVEFAGQPLVGQFHYLYGPEFTPNVSVSSEGAALHPKIAEILHQDDLRFVLLSAGGNEHNVISIVQLYQRYDFILGEQPDLPLDQNIEILPEVLVRETIREWMGEKIAVMKAIRAATSLPIVQIEPPPPLPREQVLAYPKEFFRGAVDLRKLSPDHLRHKMWRVQIGLYRELCESMGIGYVRMPAAMIDEQGMLAKKAWGQDATHANDWFGEVMILEAMAHLPPATFG
jgi:hypothetical protein